VPARPSNGEQAELCNNWLLSLIWGRWAWPRPVPNAHLPDLTALLNNLAISLAHGGTPHRITADTIDLHADADTHLGRLIAARWTPRYVPAGREYEALRRWAHMLGFRGHFSTKSRRYSGYLRGSELVQVFGYPELLQLSREGQVRQRAWIMSRRQVLMQWAVSAGIEVTNGTIPS
jgi:hypothetical protein